MVGGGETGGGGGEDGVELAGVEGVVEVEEL